MRLTLFTEYALRFMIRLASEPLGHRTTIAQASHSMGVPLNHLTKIAHRLVKAKLITPSRGRNGGLALARSASEITIAQVLRVTEPDLAIATCIPGKDCSLCGFRQLLDTALAAFFSVLNQATLADLCQQPSGHFPSEFLAPGERYASSQGSSLQHLSGGG